MTSNEPAGNAKVPALRRWWLPSVIQVATVPAVAWVTWTLREANIQTGPACDARGTWGCTFDGEFYATLTVFFGLAVAIIGFVATAAVAYYSQDRTIRLIPIVSSWVVWLMIAAWLIVGARSG